MSLKCEVILSIENVFRHDLGVCHIVYDSWVVIEELCPSPLLFLCVVTFGTYLNYDENIVLLVELAPRLS